MKVILMNKNIQVLEAEYLDSLAGFSRIYDVINIEYAPLIIKESYKKSKNLEQELTTWFRNRGIPQGRDRLDILMDKLNISSPTILLNKAFGLSLSDQYWINPYDNKLKYEDINFFDNDFNDLEFTEATFSNDTSMSSNITFMTPNNTTDGVLRKTWIIDNGKRYLLKAGLRNEVLQPFNEVLASMICERLGFNHVTYTIDTVKDNVVSKCACFITKDTELISAYQILKSKESPKLKENAYQNYIKILSSEGIKNAQEKVDNMFILDYLMLNNDRHLNNFGIIRDVNTLKWLDVAPIFDTGNSLNLLDYTDNEIIIEGDGRFFNSVDNFDNIIRKIPNIKRIDISKLDGVVEDFDTLLHNYQSITKMSDRRINKLCVMLNSQINKLKNIINEFK